MTKSALQIARAAYQPKLPKALASGAVKAVAGAATQSVHQNIHVEHPIRPDN